MSGEWIKNNVETDYVYVAIVLAIAFFWGEPDLIDSAIAVLQAFAKYLVFLSGGAA